MAKEIRDPRDASPFDAVHAVSALPTPSRLPTLSRLPALFGQSDTAWRRFLAIGLVMALGYFALPSQDAQNIAYQVPETLAILAVLGGIYLHRPTNPRPWLLLAAGLTLSTIGDWIWVILSMGYGLEPFPSIADAFYLGGQGLIVVGLLILLRGRVPGGDRSALLDSLVIAVGVGLLSWVFLMSPTVANGGGSFEEIAVALAYPVTDVLLLGVLARLFLVPGRRVLAFYLIVGAVVSTLAADSIYAFLAIGNTYQTGQLVDGGWLLSFAFWGAAALHPSMREVAEPIEPGEIRFSFWRLAVLAGASLMAPAVLVVQWALGRPLDVPVIAAGSVVLFLLVIARLGGLVADLRTTLRQRRVLEEELERQTRTDPLTGLANRVLFHDRLEHVLAARDGKAAVLFIDLDDFKTVNDAYGHDAGDTVLRSVAEDIRRAIRPGDTPARLGGDEFAVLLEGGLDGYRSGLVAERVLAAIQTPTPILTGTEGSRDYSIGASIGISLGSHDTSSAQQLMREADIAMYVAKGQGKGRFTVFEPTTHAPVLRSLELRTDLEQAIRDRQFELHYQPIVDIATGDIAGLEALVRWRHPTRGLLLPAEFIPLAEATGAIVPLGRWILEEAVNEASTWRPLPHGSASALKGPIPPSTSPRAVPSRFHGTAMMGVAPRRPFMSVNLSAIQLTESGFADATTRLLASSGLPAWDLVLETTESTRLDSETASKALRHLRLLGIRLAIDDFGTGYASLSQLRRVPFDIVKIDQSFVAALGPGSRAEAMVSGVVDLALRLNMLVVAEGIETADQLARLREMGCVLGQGFQFAAAMPATELRARLGMPARPRSLTDAAGVATGARPRPSFIARRLPEA
jgi:diguanylate cyclase